VGVGEFSGADFPYEHIANANMIAAVIKHHGRRAAVWLGFTKSPESNSPRSRKMWRPYFVREYNRFVRHLTAVEPDYEVAMSRAVGGSYSETGMRERLLLEALGLQHTHYVIDIGAGSGRLAYALKDLPKLRYLGTDVVPELLDFANKKCGRDDWSFKLVKEIEIPEDDGVADFVVFFSVFTHLREKDSYRYLQDAKRVLKKNGTIVVSFLDSQIDVHAQWVGVSWRQRLWWKERSGRIIGRATLNKLLTRNVLENWAKALNLEIEYEDADLGQSVCTFKLGR